MFDRSLLAKLSRCAWKVLNLYMTQTVTYDDAKAGGAVAVQSFGDFQNFNPHLHVIVTDGCFYKKDGFMVCPPPDTGELEKLFRYEVFRMLKFESKITDVVIENMMNPAGSGTDSTCTVVKPFGRTMNKVLKIKPATSSERLFLKSA